MVKIFACGDILLKSNNKNILSDGLQKRISSNDIVLGNLEAPMRGKKELFKAGPCLCQGEESIEILKKSGFNVLSLANNHIMDFGVGGLLNTLRECEKEKFMFTGAGLNRSDAFKPVIMRVKDINIAILSFAEKEFGAIDLSNNGPGYAWIYDPFVLENVKKIKQSSDIVIVCAHAGNEDVPFPSLNRQVLFRQLVDSGVDIVIGHHPHVPQGWEKYGTGYIFYSLGNFFFDFPYQNVCTKFNWGICVEIVLNKKNVERIEIIPVKMINNEYIDMIQTGNMKYMDYILQLSKITSETKLLLPYWQETAVFLFYNYYIRYLKRVLSNELILYCNIKTQVKHLLNFLFKKSFYIENNNFNELLLLNLFRNESHRGAIEMALSILSKDTPDLRTRETAKIFNDFLNQKC